LGTKSTRKIRELLLQKRAQPGVNIMGIFLFFETSAKDGSNVEQAFQMAARLAISRIPDEPPIEIPDIKNLHETPVKKGGCCS